MREAGPGQSQSTPDVDAEGVLPVALRGLLEHGGLHRHGHVDQHVEAPELADGGLHRTLDVPLIRYVHPHRDRLATALNDVLRDGQGTCLIDVSHHDAAAVGGEGTRTGGAHTTACPDDQGSEPFDGRVTHPVEGPGFGGAAHLSSLASCRYTARS